MFPNTGSTNLALLQLKGIFNGFRLKAVILFFETQIEFQLNENLDPLLIQKVENLMSSKTDTDFHFSLAIAKN